MTTYVHDSWLKLDRRRQSLIVVLDSFFGVPLEEKFEMDLLRTNTAVKDYAFARPSDDRQGHLFPKIVDDLERALTRPRTYKSILDHQRVHARDRSSCVMVNRCAGV